MFPPMTIIVGDTPLTLQVLQSIARGGVRLELSAAGRERIARGRAVIDRIASSRMRAYGITVGVGSHKEFAISPEAVSRYNELLLTGHATIAPGPDATRDMVRGALALQLALFATGKSGVGLDLVERLLERFNRDDLPAAKLSSSVGACDIVAMSQLGLPLLGKRGVSPGGGGGAGGRYRGLEPKEALSLLCSNSLTLSAATLAHLEVRALLDTATAVAALSLEGFRGNPQSWSEPVDRARGQPGQSKVGATLRLLLQESRLWQAGESRLLQDPLSFRCVPQIHGAAEAAFDFAGGLLESELAAICDNPMIDLETGMLLHHGNMETTACALGFDTLRLALAKVIETSGQRIHKIQWPAFTQLPTGLAQEDGATGGVQFLNVGHIATACVGAVCQSANPALLNYRGQICDGVEDVGGNAPLAIDETRRAFEPAWNVLAIEAMCAAWAIRRRAIPTAALGRPLRALSEQIGAVLPIGAEGEEIFDLGAVVSLLRAAFAPPRSDRA
jgi:histidine ammonia-lyase